MITNFIIVCNYRNSSDMKNATSIITFEKKMFFEKKKFEKIKKWKNYKCFNVTFAFKLINLICNIDKAISRTFSLLRNCNLTMCALI